MLSVWDCLAFIIQADIMHSILYVQYIYLMLYLAFFDRLHITQKVEMITMATITAISSRIPPTIL